MSSTWALLSPFCVHISKLHSPSCLLCVSKTPMLCGPSRHLMSHLRSFWGFPGRPKMRSVASKAKNILFHTEVSVLLGCIKGAIKKLLLIKLFASHRPPYSQGATMGAELYNGRVFWLEAESVTAREYCRGARHYPGLGSCSISPSPSYYIDIVH